MRDTLLPVEPCLFFACPESLPHRNRRIGRSRRRRLGLPRAPRASAPTTNQEPSPPAPGTPVRTSATGLPFSTTPPIFGCCDSVADRLFSRQSVAEDNHRNRRPVRQRAKKQRLRCRPTMLRSPEHIPRGSRASDAALAKSTASRSASPRSHPRSASALRRPPSRSVPIRRSSRRGPAANPRPRPANRQRAARKRSRIPP